LNRSLVDEVFHEHDINSVVNTAAILPMRVGHKPHPGFFEVNAWGVPNLVFAALNADIERFVQFSTNGVYQFRDHNVEDPVSEEYPTGLTVGNCYANTKALAESLLTELRNTGDIEGVVLRPGEIYGPVANRGDDSPIYWKNMLDAAVMGKSFTLENHPEHLLDWVYVKDVAELAVRVTLADEVPHSAYNASFGRCVGIYDIAETLDEVFPGNSISLHECERGGWEHPLDMGRAQADFGFTPQYDLKDGILDYAEWYAANNSREGQWR
jgi:nucleoside-diphosphate-sugar epimerase